MRAPRKAPRTESTRARPAEAPAKAPSPKASSGSMPWMPARTQTTTVSTPSGGGHGQSAAHHLDGGLAPREGRGHRHQEEQGQPHRDEEPVEVRAPRR